MVRLTQEVVASATQFTNPLKEREIDLRGRAILQIEEAALSALQDSFDVIDLSDNTIRRLDGFPKMERLTTLLIHNNNLANIARNTSRSIPNLHTLAANHNAFRELSDLENLMYFGALERVSFVGCPVALKPNYRLYLIARCPRLKLIDNNRVLQKEREEAEAVFGNTVRREREAALGGSDPNRKKRSLKDSADMFVIATTDKRTRDDSNAEQESMKAASLSHADGGAATTTTTIATPPATQEELLARLEKASSIEEVQAIEKELMEMSAQQPKKRKVGN